MSRTYKDRPWKVRFPEQNWRVTNETHYERVPYEAEGINYWDKKPYNEIRYFSVKKPGVLTKKRKNCNHEYRWLQNEPSWFTRDWMNAPKRKHANRMCRTISNLEELDIPDTRNLPKVYYW